MDFIMAKLRIKGSREKYRKVVSTNKMVYPDISEIPANAVKYDPDTLLEDDQYYKITDFSQQSFSNNLTNFDGDTPNYETLSRDEFDKIDFIFVKRADDLLFQNISKSKLISKKSLFFSVGGSFEYNDEDKSIQINAFPDAVYVKEQDTLFFRKIESITTIFKGISELYREAKQEETEELLRNDFIKLEDGFTASDVKTSNRKRIAMAMDTLSRFNEKDKKKIFKYVHDYCPSITYKNNQFSIGSEDSLKNLLYGIEQRFYTTPIGNEKRIANSIIRME